MMHVFYGEDLLTDAGRVVVRGADDFASVGPPLVQFCSWWGLGEAVVKGVHCSFVLRSPGFEGPGRVRCVRAPRGGGEIAEIG